MSFLLAFSLGAVSALTLRAALYRLLGPRAQLAEDHEGSTGAEPPRAVDDAAPSLLQITGHPARWIANSKRLAGQQGDRNQGERKQGLREIR